MKPFDQQITFLYTRDLKRTAQFYEELLGLELVRDQGDCRIYKVSAQAYVGFCERLTAPETPQGILLTLITDEVDAWYGRLTGGGLPVEKPPQLNPKYNIYHFFVRDPNGYLIEVQKFLEPLP